MHIPKIKLKFLRKLLPKRRRDRERDRDARDRARIMERESRDADAASLGGLGAGVPSARPSAQAMLFEAEPPPPPVLAPPALAPHEAAPVPAATPAQTSVIEARRPQDLDLAPDGVQEDEDHNGHSHDYYRRHQRRPAKSFLRTSSRPKGGAPPPSPTTSSISTSDERYGYGNYDDADADADDDDINQYPRFRSTNFGVRDLGKSSSASTSAAASASASASASSSAFATSPEARAAAAVNRKMRKLKQTRRNAAALPAPPPLPPAPAAARLQTPPEECPICHDPVGVRNPEGICETWTKLHCGHKFGTNCLRIWIQASLGRSDRGGYGVGGGRPTLPTCPVCRTVARPVGSFLVYPHMGRCSLG